MLAEERQLAPHARRQRRPKTLTSKDGAGAPAAASRVADVVTLPVEFISPEERREEAAFKTRCQNALGRGWPVRHTEAGHRLPDTAANLRVRFNNERPSPEWEPFWPHLQAAYDALDAATTPAETSDAYDRWVKVALAMLATPTDLFSDLRCRLALLAGIVGFPAPVGRSIFDLEAASFTPGEAAFAVLDHQLFRIGAHSRRAPQ